MVAARSLRSKRYCMKRNMYCLENSFRICGSNGMWLDRYGLPNEVGWTNYTPCFTQEMVELIRRLNSGSEIEIQVKMHKYKSCIYQVMVIYSLMNCLILMFVGKIRDCQTNTNPGASRKLSLITSHCIFTHYLSIL